MKCQCITEQRRLVPAVFNLKQALNGTQTMTWTLTEHLTDEGTCDLCNYDPYLLLCVGGQIDEVMLSRNMADLDGDGVAEAMQIHWAVGAYATELTGYVKYQIVFRSAEVNTLGVIGSADESANGNYKLTSGSQGTARAWTNEVSGYVCRYNDAEARWEIYGADGASLVHYQVFPQEEPYNGAWNDCAVGNNTAAVWASDEAIMHISESIAADPHVTANYPTILRQMWFALQRGAASTGGSNSMEVPVKSAEWAGSAEPYYFTAGKEQTLGAKVHAAYFRNSAGVMVDNMEFEINADGATVRSLEKLDGTLVLIVSREDDGTGNGGGSDDDSGNADDGTDEGGADGGEDTGGEPEEPTVTYAYTVSGSPDSAVNGDYWDTGETFNGEPIYTNGTAYLQYCGTNGMWSNWSIHNKKADQTYDTCYCYRDPGNSGVAGTYQGGTLSTSGCTVTAYSAGGDSDGAGGTVVISGCPNSSLNGTYTLASGDPSTYNGATYVNGSNQVFVNYDGMITCVKVGGDLLGTVTYYFQADVFETLTGTKWSIGAFYRMSDGAAADGMMAVVNIGGSSGSGSSGGTDYNTIIVSGAGSTEYNGTYTTDPTQPGVGTWENGGTIYFSGDNGKVIQIWYDSGMGRYEAQIGQGPPAYAGSFASKEDLPNATWSSAVGGAAPMPTVKFGG